MEQTGDSGIPKEVPKKTPFRHRMGNWISSLRLPLTEQNKLPVSLNIFYINHGSSADLQRLPEVFSNSDVYAVEVIGHRQSALEMYNAVSKGKRDPAVALESLMREKGRTRETDPELFDTRGFELKMIHNSRKPIIFLDVPEDHPAVQLEKRAGELRDSIYSNTVDKGGPSFDRLVEMVKQYFQMSSDGNKIREDYTRDHLKPLLEEALQNNPNLKKKKNINVLMVYGAAHVGLDKDLSVSNEYRITKEFSNKPFIYEYETIGMIRSRLGKEVSETIATRALLEIVYGELILEQIWPLTQDNNKINHVLRKVASQFNVDEIKNIIEERREGLEYPGALFLNKLADKGMRIPSSKEKLDAFLATR